MKINYRKSFLKELSKIPSGTRSKIEAFIFEELPKANSIFGIGIVEKMKRISLILQDSFLVHIESALKMKK